MNYAALENEAKARHLRTLGGFHPMAQDKAPKGTRTLLLLGPDEPAFWPALTESPEWQDAAPDPVDRWSERIVTTWAKHLGARALFPFGGPPYLPFFSWALRTGRIHASPIRLLVHDTAGLFVSFRGALALPERIDLPAPPDAPCPACTAQPCRTACPVSALNGADYDVAACKTYIGTAEGDACMSQGCAARRACPVSQSYPRLPAQSAYHMTAFKG